MQERAPSQVDQAGSDTDPAELLDLAVEVALEAGGVAERARTEGVQVATTKTNLLDVVTAADLEAETLIKAHLLERRPQDGFVGEETDEVDTHGGVTWVVDPIDGTVNYLYGDPTYAVSVAAAIAGTEEVGVVYSPGLKQLWTARRGDGATMNGRRVRTAPSPSPHQPLLGTVFAYDDQQRRQQMRRLADSATTIRDVRVSGSATLDICRVAAGDIDIFCTDSVSWWDVAAGVVIAREAGCRVRIDRDAPGGSVTCIVANPAVSDDLLGSLGYAVPAP